MRAIVISGGGSKNAYSAGCLQYLLGELENKYDIHAGVSSGGINVAFLAQFPHGQEKEAAKELCRLWSELNTKKVYKSWKPFGALSAAWRQSFYDSSPLHKLIHSTISLGKIRQTGKQVSVGAVSLNSGKYLVFDQTHDKFIDAVIASASFPVSLPPVRIGNELFTDGGLKSISPLYTAIDLGATEIDLIITSPEKRIKMWVEHPGILDILKRSIDLFTDKILANDIERAQMYNRLAEAGFTDKKYVKLNIIRPDNNLIEDLLDFNPAKIKKMIEIGYNDARTKHGANKA